MKNVRIAKPILIGILLCVEVAYFSACGNNKPSSPSGPDDSEPRILAMSDPPESDLLLVSERAEEEEGVSTALIGPKGDVLVHADHRVEVSARALSKPVELTFSMPVSDTLMFELGPDGIRFNAPVTAIFNYDNAVTSGLDEENFSIVVWNPVSQSWEAIPSTVDTAMNEVSGDLEHFSRYAISK